MNNRSIDRSFRVSLLSSAILIRYAADMERKWIELIRYDTIRFDTDVQIVLHAFYQLFWRIYLGTDQATNLRDDAATKWKADRRN
mmetsp:Transcript_22712/g.49415  ORF Transcript_22712/g.49415 Transcript_22712/m.49415 type:complete len:85 (+) Transcript_22712:64-318(+)